MSRSPNLHFKQGFDYAVWGISPHRAPVSDYEIVEYQAGLRHGQVELENRRRKEAIDFEASQLDADAAWVRAQRLEWEASQ